MTRSLEWFDKNRIVVIAMFLSFVYHGSLLLLGTYKRTYDAYVHIFFADHYARFWWDPWDTRWYTGFTLTSYPPLSHQLTAIFSKILGLELAFALVFLFGMITLTLGIYRFSRLWVNNEAAGAAALLCTFSSSIAITIHVFGQLPTILSLSFLTNALPFVYQWVDRGNPYDLARAWAFTAATTAGHHVTTLFGAVFFMGPIFATVLLKHFRTPRLDEDGWHNEVISLRNTRDLAWRRLRRIAPGTLRSAIFGVGLIVLLIVVVFPYWYWSATDPITQVSIPHASRDSFLENIPAGQIFWLLPYGMFIFILPYAFYKGFTTKNWIMSCSLWFLFLLGTGGTTPLPKMILGGAFDILTLDRFTFWATIWLLPFGGQFLVSLFKGRIKAWLIANFNVAIWRLVQLFFVAGFLFMSAFCANLTQFRRFQPAPVDPTPIVDFIEKDEHWRWRYGTLGMGDQMAWLSAQTLANQADGNYHSARRLPELTTTPVERLEGAKFRGLPGISSLEQFVTIPDKYNLKFIFSNDEFYDPLLYFSGWHRLVRLGNGIVVWERADTPPLPEKVPRKYLPGYQRLMWGVLPITAFLAALTITSLSLFKSILRKINTDLQVTRYTKVLLWVWKRRIGKKLPNFLHHPLGWLSWLLTLFFPVHRPNQEPHSEEDWQFWRRVTNLIPALNLETRSPSRRLIQTITLLLFMATVGTTLSWPWYQEAHEPAHVVEEFFDDLDFKRFPQSFEHIAAASGISLDQYLLKISLKGGLVSSYSKLDNLYVTELSREQDVTTVQVKADWVTALNEYSTKEEMTLIREEGAWKILRPPQIFQLPPDTIFSRPDITWGKQSRRQLVETGNPFADLIDRPVLQIISSRMVFYEGRVAVVGELINLDTIPADLTVTALLRDREGDKITQYNAKDVIIHKILPKEITPFRVDFVGVVSDTIASTINPVDDREVTPAEADEQSDEEKSEPIRVTPELLRQEIGSYDIYAKAVGTVQDLDRDLGFYEHRWTKAGVEGQLVNIGTVEIAIPHLLVTLYDDKGRVMWVDHTYQEESLRSQQRQDFRILLPKANEIIEILDDRGGLLYGREWDPNFGPNLDVPNITKLPAARGRGYTGYRLSTNYFLLGSL